MQESTPPSISSNFNQEKQEKKTRSMKTAIFKNLVIIFIFNCLSNLKKQAHKQEVSHLLPCFP